MKIFFIILMLNIVCSPVFASSSSNIEKSLSLYKEGKVLLKQTNYENALEKFEQALTLDPENEMTKFYIDQIKFEINPEYSYKQMLTTDNNKIDVLSSLFFKKGKKFFNKKKYQKAVSCFKKIWLIDPTNQLTSDALFYVDKAQIEWEKQKIEKKLKQR